MATDTNKESICSEKSLRKFSIFINNFYAVPLQEIKIGFYQKKVRKGLTKSIKTISIL